MKKGRLPNHADAGVDSLRTCRFEAPQALVLGAPRQRPRLLLVRLRLQRLTPADNPLPDRHRVLLLLRRRKPLGKPRDHAAFAQRSHDRLVFRSCQVGQAVPRMLGLSAGRVGDAVDVGAQEAPRQLDHGVADVDDGVAGYRTDVAPGRVGLGREDLQAA